MLKKRIWEHIERQDSSTKSQYSFVIASVITGCVAFVWALSLPARVQTVASLITVNKSGTDSNSLGSVLEDSKKQLGAVIEGVEDQRKQVANENGEVDEATKEVEVVEGALGSIGTTDSTTGSSTDSDTIPEQSISPEVPAQTPVESGRIILIGTTTQNTQ